MPPRLGDVKRMVGDIIREWHGCERMLVVRLLVFFVFVLLSKKLRERSKTISQQTQNQNDCVCSGTKRVIDA